MEDLKEQKTAYYLFQKDRIYRDKTLTSIYFKSNNQQVEKKSRPIDLDGIRYKLDLQTGELDTYKKSEVLNSMNASLRRTKILMNMLLEMNDFDWFATLTFDKEKIDRTNDELVYNTYKKYINNIKHQFPSFKYLTVLERHEDGCIHFHLLIAGLTPKQLGLVNSGKVCCSWAFYKNKIASKEYYERTKHLHEKELQETDGLPVYNVTTFPYGLTTVTRIASRERCNNYVKKYINKDIGKSTQIFKKRFFYSSNLNVPKVVERLIGADFETPKNIKNYMSDSPHLQNADYINYNKDYNVLQFWEDNETKESINNGLIPLSLSEQELVELDKLFCEQLKN
ncbi:MAG: hypothetical protein ACI4TT_01755 [Christensenellales bacterium]